ncbi:MAG: response regulator transcription factor [Deltaproteobacteria bacterium]|nr:response regulator transcription factor [Deltaproteobacteria bacterium]
MLKVLVCDDHPIVREGLKQLLGDDPLIGKIGEAASGNEALAKLQAEPWDVFVLDLMLPDRHGLDVLKQAKCYQPDVPVLVLTMHAEDQYAVRALKAGAAAYLTKESAPEQLREAVHKVVSGGRYVSPSLAEKVLLAWGDQGEAPLHAVLSDREFEILCLLASGKTVTEIAHTLGVSVKTVSTYRTRMLEKMEMKTTADLIAYAIRGGLV